MEGVLLDRWPNVTSRLKCTTARWKLCGQQFWRDFGAPCSRMRSKQASHTVWAEAARLHLSKAVPSVGTEYRLHRTRACDVTGPSGHSLCAEGGDGATFGAPDSFETYSRHSPSGEKEGFRSSNRIFRKISGLPPRNPARPCSKGTLRK